MASRGNASAVFGQTMRKKKHGGRSNYQRQFQGGSYKTIYRSADNETENADLLAAQKRRQRQKLGEQIDGQLGVLRFTPKSHEGEIPDESGLLRRRGWLYNILPTTVRNGGDVYHRSFLSSTSDLKPLRHHLNSF